jgi:ATP-dependent Lon protease
LLLVSGGGRQRREKRRQSRRRRRWRGGIMYMLSPLLDPCLLTPGGIYAPLWMAEDDGTLTAVVAATRPGEGGVVMSGWHDVDAKHGIQVAVSWVASQVGPLCHWLASSHPGLRGRSVLWHTGEQLSIYRTGNQQKLYGPSVSVCIALSLVCMLVRRRAKRTMAMTGALDLRGNVLPVGGLQGKLRGCQQRDYIDTLLVPEASLARLSIDSLPADLRDYARRVLRGVRTMTDVIQLAIEGEYRGITFLGPAPWDWLWRGKDPHAISYIPTS